MSRNRPDILASRSAARPLQRLEAHLGDVSEAPGLREVLVTQLWLRHQPRKLVPDSVLERLLAADRAQPAALLAELEALAAEETSVHAETLRALHELAATIRVHGVLVPIRLAHVDDRLVVEEGHRRSLAALLAGLDRVPAIVAPSASELLLAARQFVANDQRADLSALEKAAGLRDLIAKADRELRLRKGWALDEPSFASLFEGADEEEEEPNPRLPLAGAGPGDARGATRDTTSVPPRRPPLGKGGEDAVPFAPPSPVGKGGANGTNGHAAPSAERFERDRHKGEVRAQVLSLTGLSLGRYYQLRQLNRLCPEARDLAVG